MPIPRSYRKEQVIIIVTVTVTRYRIESKLPNVFFMPPSHKVLDIKMATVNSERSVGRIEVGEVGNIHSSI